MYAVCLVNVEKSSDVELCRIPCSCIQCEPQLCVRLNFICLVLLCFAFVIFVSIKLLECFNVVWCIISHISYSCLNASQSAAFFTHAVVFIKSAIAIPVQYNPNTVPLSHGGSWPGANFRSFNIHRKGENAIKNKTNTVPNPTTNPNSNPTIDEAGKRKEMK